MEMCGGGAMDAVSIIGPRQRAESKRGISTLVKTVDMTFVSVFGLKENHGTSMDVDMQCNGAGLLARFLAAALQHGYLGG